MSSDRSIVVCALLSVLAHGAFAGVMRRLPKRAGAAVKRTVSIRVISPPPAPEPPPEPALPQPAPAPRPVPLERTRSRHPPEVAPAVAPRDVPPPEHPPPAAAGDTGGPVFGVSMESTSQAGAGPSMPIGNPANRPAAHAGGGTKDEGDGEAATPVAAYEVTTMPLPQGRCAGKYTEEAKAAAVEGTVVLDLVVGADGRVRQVRVVSGLGYGLTEAAVAAAKACRFSPGAKGDVPVPVRIREFKIRFVLQNDE